MPLLSTSFYILLAAFPMFSVRYSVRKISVRFLDTITCATKL